MIIRFDRTLGNSCLGDCELSIDNSDKLTISTSERRSSYIVDGISGEGWEYIVVRQGELLAIIGESSECVRILNNHGVLLKVLLNRYETDDAAFYRQDFHTVENGVVLVYESGLVFFDVNFKVKWMQNIQRIDCFFQRIEGNKLLYHSEHEGDWYYDLNTGCKKELLD